MDNKSGRYLMWLGAGLLFVAVFVMGEEALTPDEKRARAIQEGVYAKDPYCGDDPGCERESYRMHLAYKDKADAENFGIRIFIGLLGGGLLLLGYQSAKD
jgi:hypothetical protein